MKESEFIWALAHIGPATPQEVAELLDKSHPSASRTATSLWRRGLTVRRKREAVGGQGRNPYEYVLSSPSEKL